MRAVRACPELRTLLHSAQAVTAQHLNRYPRLVSLGDLLCAPVPLPHTLVAGLSRLTGLQHLRLSQCDAPPAHKKKMRQNI